MKAGLVLLRVHQLNLWLRRRSLLHWRWLLSGRVLGRTYGMFSNRLEGIHNPALRLFQPMTRLDRRTAFRNPHRSGAGRTAPTFKSSFRLQLPLLVFNPPTGVRSKRMTSLKEARLFFGTLFDSCANIRPI